MMQPYRPNSRTVLCGRVPVSVELLSRGCPSRPIREPMPAIRDRVMTRRRGSLGRLGEGRRLSLWSQQGGRTLANSLECGGQGLSQR